MVFVNVLQPYLRNTVENVYLLPTDTKTVGVHNGNH